MKIAAVIAEYNPFHKGHAFHLEQTRRETGASHILVVMSGDYVQRGAPAFCNKYLRTHMALLGGADAVLELPTLYSSSSAEYFAGGAVTLLNQLGCVDVLSFGSESGQLSGLQACADALANKDSDLKDQILKHQKNGRSYPAAVSAALDLPKELRNLLLSPNNLLAIEYLKALTSTESSITPFTIQRRGDYHVETLSADDAAVFASASALRKLLAEDPAPASIQEHVPASVFAFMQQNHLLNRPVQEDDFSTLLQYKLLLNALEGYSSYLDCTSDLSNKISKNLSEFTTFSGFCALLKSKDLTYTRISRALLHILLDMKTPETFRQDFTSRSLYVPYARLLGFRKEAAPLLTALKKHSSIPLLSKPADASSLLSETAYRMFLSEVQCSQIYEAVSQSPASFSEWKQSPIVLP